MQEVKITEDSIIVEFEDKIRLIGVEITLNQRNVAQTLVRSVENMKMDGLSTYDDYSTSKVFIYFDKYFARQLTQSVTIRLNAQACSSVVSCNRLIDYRQVHVYHINCDDQKDGHNANVAMKKTMDVRRVNCNPVDCRKLDIDADAVYTLSPDRNVVVNGSVAYCNVDGVSAMMTCLSGDWFGDIRDLNRISSICNSLLSNKLDFVLIMFAAMLLVIK